MHTQAKPHPSHRPKAIVHRASESSGALRNFTLAMRACARRLQLAPQASTLWALGSRVPSDAMRRGRWLLVAGWHSAQRVAMTLDTATPLQLYLVVCRT
jgi:hypothetical protein